MTAPVRPDDAVSTVDGQKNPPYRGKKVTAKDKHVFPVTLVLDKLGFSITGIWLFPGVLKGLGRSRKLVGTISTYPGTYKCQWSQSIAKNAPGGVFFT